jgi:hypothetical protein
VAGDKALQAKVNEILGSAGKDGEDATKNKLLAFAKEQGYDITVGEMQAFFRELNEKSESELSETELDMVAGGKSKYTMISILTFGIGCAVASMIADSNSRMGDVSCGDLIDGNVFIQGK